MRTKLLWGKASITCASPNPNPNPNLTSTPNPTHLLRAKHITCASLASLSACAEMPSSGGSGGGGQRSPGGAMRGATRPEVEP